MCPFQLELFFQPQPQPQPQPRENNFKKVLLSQNVKEEMLKWYLLDIFTSLFKTPSYPIIFPQMYKIPQLIFNTSLFKFNTPSFEFNTPLFDLKWVPIVKKLLILNFC
jgi:hypothetical protein